MPSWRRGTSGHIRGIYFVDPEDKEFKETIRNARKKLEMPMAPAMPCKTSKNNQIWATGDESNKIETKLACMKPVNPQDCVWNMLNLIITKTILQERRTIYYNITIWYTNLFLCFKPWRFRQQRQQWTRNGKNWKRFRRGTWQKSKVRKVMTPCIDDHHFKEELRSVGEFVKCMLSGCSKMFILGTTWTTRYSMVSK